MLAIQGAPRNVQVRGSIPRLGLTLIPRQTHERILELISF